MPQGESPMDVVLRTKLLLDTIFRDNSDPLFVVSHGATIKTIIMNFFHFSPEWYNAEAIMENCAIRLIDRENEIKGDYIYKEPKKV